MPQLLATDQKTMTTESLQTKLSHAKSNTSYISKIQFAVKIDP